MPVEVGIGRRGLGPIASIAACRVRSRLRLRTGRAADRAVRRIRQGSTGRSATRRFFRHRLGPTPGVAVTWPSTSSTTSIAPGGICGRLGRIEARVSGDVFGPVRAGLLGVQTIGRWSGLVTIQAATGGHDDPVLRRVPARRAFPALRPPAGKITGQTYGLAALCSTPRQLDQRFIVKNLYVARRRSRQRVAGQRQRVLSGMKTAGASSIADTSGPFFVGYGRSAAATARFT